MPQCPIKSGIQTLRLRRNGFVSLSTNAAGNGAAASGGTLVTRPFVLPSCPSGEPLALHLNIFTSIGRGAFVELESTHSAGVSGKQLRSTQILGGDIDLVAEWMELNATGAKKTEQGWLNGGCAYEASVRNKSLPAGACDQGNYHKDCSAAKDCECYVLPGSTSIHCDSYCCHCGGVHTECLGGICQAPNVSGGESCGRWIEVAVEPSPKNVGTDLNKVFTSKEHREVVLSMSMWSSDLYSLQFVCGHEGKDGSMA